ncbi:hypothetical protein ACA910_021106 [Epithemia clementina (nom. ined.)]
MAEAAAKGGAQFDVSVHWFRNGLRLHDNPALLAACRESKSVFPIYVIDPDAPFAQTASRKAGVIRANFILESLRELDGKLQSMGSKLYVLLGDPTVVVPDVIAATRAKALFYEIEAASPVRDVDRRVRGAINDQHTKGKISEGCEIRSFDTHTLFAMDKYLSKCREQVAPSTYGGFTKIFKSLTVSKEVETAGLKNRARGGIDFQGGEDAAIELLDKMMKKEKWVATFEKPNTSPNALTVDTTGLSPYVKHGCLSCRRFFHALSKVYAKFHHSEISKPPVSLHGQLMWREYNYLMGYSTPNFDQMVNNPIARQIPWDDDPAMLDAWRNSKTGYPFIDAIMTQLRETGWIHHLARHSVACFLTRGDLWQSWEKGAEVFEELLIDADWSINNFNWQWLSCTAHFYQYFRCYSPVAFGKKTDPNGDYIRKWLPQFKNMPKAFIYTPWDAPIDVQKKCGVIIGRDYPMPIVDHSVISKANMGRMKEAYEEQSQREQEANENRNNESRRKRQRT